jgi:hypothetical protein
MTACDDKSCPSNEKRGAKRRNDWLFVAIAGQSVVSKQHLHARLRSKFFQLEYCYIPVTAQPLQACMCLGPLEKQTGLHHSQQRFTQL